MVIKRKKEALMSVWDNLKNKLDTGLEGSKKVFSAAKEKAQDLGEKGVVKVELTQLRSKKDHLYKEVGAKVHLLLGIEGRGSVSLKTAELKPLFEELTELEESIQQKEILLQKEEEKNEN